MQCPTCVDERLVMSERQGIEVDYCPRCRGVWLDRGELDKIIERSAQAALEDLDAERRAAARGPDRDDRRPDDRRPDDRRADERRADGRRDLDDDDWSSSRYGKGKKKKSFLSEILDF